MSVRVRAPGKVNVSLRCGAPDAEGYHPLVTVFQAVSMTEDVTATAAEGFSLEVHGRQADDVPTDATNLALRAARLLAEVAGVTQGVHLRIDKGVPTAGGMAGGSADAAAALLACDLLWGVGLDREELGRLAAELGADVPFALAGHTAVGVGRGDVLSPALSRGTFHWVLALSGEGLSTPAVFREWDRLHPDAPRTLPEPDAALMHALVRGDAQALAPHVRNDLEDAALSLRPDLVDTLAAFAESDALVATVSGSGPTIMGLAPDAAAAAAIADEIRDAGVAREVLVVSGPVPGARAIEAVRR